MTENCRATAQKYGLVSEVEALFKKVEKDQTVQSWDTFLPTPYIKKGLGSSFRLVCAKQSLMDLDIIVISFITCFPRGGNGEYEKFIDNPDQICGKYLPDTKILRDYIESRKDPLPEPPPELNDAELEYLFDTLEPNSMSELMVYESSDWVDAMKSTNMFDLSTRLYDLLIKIIESGPSISDEFIEDTKSGTCISFKYIPAHQCIFLIAPYLKTNSATIVQLSQKYQILTGENAKSREFILKYCRRSYPAYILADEQMWKAIEKNDVGNIALSPEESNILEEVTRRSSDKIFPLFINGRPGSGKSTILQYLFASYLCMYLRNADMNKILFPPLYLTYSEELLETAKKNVDDILKCNSSIALYAESLDSVKASQIRENCFGLFHKFLLDLLPAEKKLQFSYETKVNFPKFRKLWDERREKIPQSEIRKLSPELTWHVLRSYIKGMHYDPEFDFSIELYSDLPKSQQTVQIETFKRIYQDVWLGWYKPLSEKYNYWDDQDLVFAVLNEPNIELSRYPAIFCDEAQDFSKLELALILRLSLYSQRNLAPHLLKRVPFSFAGDPFQTLNPTGFDWESLQANFHEKIVSGLDKSSIGKLEFNYQELSYNYRSGKFIVGLCNLLQLLRGIVFNEKNLRPQQNWFDVDASMPVYFNVKDPLCEQKLRAQTELVIILPCQEGEEEEFVKNDVFLNELAASEIDIRNFLSPMRAKGLEFSRVVLYKFGSVCNRHYPDLFSPLSTGEPHTDNKDTSLPLKYFINRLYVGASRAKNRLIIVDDDKGIESLWDDISIKSLENLLKRYQPASKYEWIIDNINYVQKGVEDNWTQDRDDPLTLAEGFHTAGLAEEDPYKLRLAEANYKRCGQQSNAKLCCAERLEMENLLTLAGEQYLELDRTIRALECFWEDGNFRAIANCVKFSNTPEHRAAIYYIGENGSSESKRFLDFLYTQIKKPNDARISRDRQWKKMLDRCLESIVKNPKEEDFERIYSLIKEIEIKGLSPSDKKKYAQLAFYAKEYNHALSLWESGDTSQIDIRDYYIAKANVSPFPSNLPWFEKMKEYSMIKKAWTDNHNMQIDDKSMAIILEALLQTGDYDNARVLVQDHPDEVFLRRCYEVLRTNSSNIYADSVGQSLISCLAGKGKWKDIVDIFADKKLHKTSLNIFSNTLALEVARSQEIRQATGENKNAIAILLKKLFIDSPWESIVPMRVAGAAIENAYKIIDALEFYEGVWKKERILEEKNDVDYAVARWVKSKLRLAELLEKEGNRSAASKHRTEAESICRSRLRKKLDNIPDDPEFDVSNEKMKATVTSSLLLKVSSDKRDAILDLYKIGRTAQDLARIFSLDVSLVDLIIKEDSC